MDRSLFVFGARIVVDVAPVTTVVYLIVVHGVVVVFCVVVIVIIASLCVVLNFFGNVILLASLALYLS